MSTFFSKNLLHLRNRKKINQAEMASMLHLGRSTYANYENGRTEPNFNILRKISLKLGISTDNLLFTDLTKGEVIEKRPGTKYLEKGEVKGEVTGEVIKEPLAFYQINQPDPLITALMNSLQDKDKIISAKDALINNLNAQLTALKRELIESKQFYLKLKEPAQKSP